MGTFPGAVLKVANSTNILYSNAFGHISHQKIPFGSSPFTEDTIFDIASLTKVSATLSAIMHLYQEKQLDIFDKVSKFIPEYANSGKQNTTIQNLLLHNAGLAPDYPFLNSKTTKS
jgi:beta-N-acetylhexosaminidase